MIDRYWSGNSWKRSMLFTSGAANILLCLVSFLKECSQHLENKNRNLEILNKHTGLSSESCLKLSVLWTCDLSETALLTTGLALKLEYCLFHILGPISCGVVNPWSVSIKRAPTSDDGVCVSAHALHCPCVCLHTVEQHVHEHSVVGGAPCSFLFTLWWFSSASKSQLWSTWSSCSGVTTRTLTGLLRKPRSMQSEKMTLSW